MSTIKRDNMFGLLKNTSKCMDTFNKNSSDPIEAFENLKAEINEDNIKFFAKELLKLIFESVSDFQSI
jgi:hypothetical protein